MGRTKPVGVRLIGWMAAAMWIAAVVTWTQRAAFRGDPGYVILLTLLVVIGGLLWGAWFIASLIVMAVRRGSEPLTPNFAAAPGSRPAPAPVRTSPLSLRSPAPATPAAPRLCSMCRAQLPVLACLQHSALLCLGCFVAHDSTAHGSQLAIAFSGTERTEATRQAAGGM